MIQSGSSVNSVLHRHEIHSIFKVVTRLPLTRKGQNEIIFACLVAGYFPEPRQSYSLLLSAPEKQA